MDAARDAGSGNEEPWLRQPFVLDTSGTPDDARMVCHGLPGSSEFRADSFANGEGLERSVSVKKSCTKKLDFLVAADPDSMSGKARKARDYGIRILAEPVFWQMMGVDIE